MCTAILQNPSRSQDDQQLTIPGIIKLAILCPNIWHELKFPVRVDISIMKVFKASIVYIKGWSAVL